MTSIDIANRSRITSQDNVDDFNTLQAIQYLENEHCTIVAFQGKGGGGGGGGFVQKWETF